MRSVLLGSALVVITISHAVAQSTDQFDLVCTGQATGQIMAINIGAPAVSLTPSEKGPVPYKTNLRVDLKAKRFCQDDCKLSEAIVWVTPDTIWFRNNGGLELLSRLVVQRGDGSFKYEWSNDVDPDTHRVILSKTATGECIKAPFTAIPANRF